MAQSTAGSFAFAAFPQLSDQDLSLPQDEKDVSMQFAHHLATQVQRYRAHAEIPAVRSAKERALAALHEGHHQDTVTERAGQINLTHESCYRAIT
ncbi:hypothetical protein [uncultured Sulfitobacter sp.]|uniref:hypothetical protein n=1 Tax=uncultured Sulfitobacter sp. TaxID=191468 RepID=UPI002606AB7F|nr:hypothetical protein [uncultured Sulfitobacter sp.]